MKMCIPWTVIVFFGAFQLAWCENFFERCALQQYIRDKSDKDVRPIFNQSDILEVTVMTVISSVGNLDERTQVLSSSFGMMYSWKSDILQWNESEFGGATYLTVSPSDVWMPHISLVNTEKNELLIESDIRVQINSDGASKWSAGGKLETSCSVDVKYYPFDVQVCPLVFGEAFSQKETIKLVPSMSTVFQSLYTPNDAWDLTDAIVRTQFYPSVNHTRMVVELTLSRRPGFFILNIIIPMVILSFMNILSFKLPVASGERVSYCISLFLTFTVLMGSISDSMPKVSSISFLQLYINAQLVLAMVITAFSITLVYISTTYKKDDTPSWLLVCICFKRKSGVGGKEDTEDQDDINKNKREMEEQSTGTADMSDIVNKIDKVLFAVALGFFCLINIAFALWFIIRK